MRDQHNLKFKITNLSGEQITYNLLPLKRKQAAYVAHTFLQTLLKSLGTAASGGTEALLEALGNVEFETIWNLASILLRDAEIHHENGIERIGDLEQTDYFSENPEELYLAVFSGIKENYPKFFLKVRGLLDGLARKTSDLVKGPQFTQET